MSKINKCRVCNNENLETIIELGDQFLTGVFPSIPSNKDISFGPLTLVKCHGGEDVCGLLQLSHSYDHDEMYGLNYGYRSSLNPSMVKHLYAKVDSILSRMSLQKDDLVIDVGSNDGTTFGRYPEHLHLLGIDPTGKKFSSYYKPHIQLIADFFSSDLVKEKFPDKKAKVISSFAMFYDLEDPVGFASQIASVLDPEIGIWVFEQSYMPAMLKTLSFDTICHEHLEFYALKQIEWICAKVGLKLVDVEFNDVNGGSFSIVAAHKNSIHQPNLEKINQIKAQESADALDSMHPYKVFADAVKKTRIDLIDFVSEVNKNGQRICALGASTKGNVLLQYCGFTSSDIESVGDVNPDKFGSFTPGTCLPIMNEDEVLDSQPDYLMILPWHFRDFFINNPKFSGRKLVFPLPKLEIVEID